MTSRRHLLLATAATTLLPFAVDQRPCAGLAAETHQDHRDLCAGRLVGHRGAAAAARPGGKARPAGDRRQQAGRRQHHWRQRGGQGAGRRLHAAAVEHRADQHLAVHARQVALRPDQELHAHRLHRLGAQCVRGQPLGTRADHDGTGGLDQGPEDAGQLRLGRRRLHRPRHRRDVQAAVRPEHGARALQRLVADAQRPAGRHAAVRGGHADAERAVHEGRQAGRHRRHLASAHGAGAQLCPPSSKPASPNWWPKTSSASPRRPACRKT